MNDNNDLRNFSKNHIVMFKKLFKHFNNVYFYTLFSLYIEQV